MPKDILVSQIENELLQMLCLESSGLLHSFAVKETDKKFVIILESSPLFFTFQMDPNEKFFRSSKISFLRFDLNCEAGYNYYRISPEVFLESIPEEARMEFLFHLDLLRRFDD